MHLFAGKAQFSLCHAMSELLALGVSIEQLVPMVTSNCANMLGMGSEIGSLVPGMGADIGVLNIENGNWTFVDNSHVEVPTEKLLTPAFCLRDGGDVRCKFATLPQPNLIAA